MALPAFVTDVSHTVWDSIKIGDYNPNTFSLPFQQPLSSAAHHHLSPQICQLTLNCFSQAWDLQAETSEWACFEAAWGAPNWPSSDSATTAEGRGKHIPTLLVLLITTADPFHTHKRIALFHLLSRAGREVRRLFPTRRGTLPALLPPADSLREREAGWRYFPPLNCRLGYFLTAPGIESWLHASWQS